MGAKRFLAVDLGASGGKGFVGSFEDGAFAMREIHRFAHECVSFYQPDQTGKLVERMYWDDVALYANILECLRACRREFGPELDAIGIDAWGADGQFITPDGEVLGKVYAYRDHRLDNMADELKACMPAEEIYALTGIHFQPFNVSNQILWFLRNRRSWLAPGCRYAPIPALFYYYLGGVLKIDSAWASVTQLMDAASRSWSAEILRRLDIPPEILPEIVPPGSVIGALLKPIADAVGLHQAQLVAVGSHDTASAYAAAPVDNPREALIISSGTWSLVGRLIPQPITNAAAMAAKLSNEGGIGNVRLLKNCMGGWLAHELRRGWRALDGRAMEWDELYRQARAALPFQALIDPDDPCFYNPRNMEQAMAEYCIRTGQVPPATRGGFVRMAYESLALQYRRINDDIAQVSGVRSKVVHIVGGGSRNELLNQFTADALGLPVVAGPVEATAIGNIMAQAMGLGLISSLRDTLPIIKQAFPIKEFKPRDTAAWDVAYERFVNLKG